MAGSIDVEVWQVPIPFRTPILTPAGPFEAYHHLVVVLRDGTHEGWGYGAVVTPDQLGAATETALRLLGDGAPDLDAILGVEELTAVDRPEAADALTRVAVTALSVAAWDLTGRQAGVACADLWGRVSGAAGLDCYWSGFFLDASLDQLVEEAAAARNAGYRLAKMRAGPDIDAGLTRLAAVRPFFDRPGAIAVDAVCSWTPEQALAFITGAGADLLWVEDAAPYDQLHVVSAAGAGAPLAAGESLTTVADLAALRTAAGMDDLLLDMQMLGGPTAFLAAARSLLGLGARIGAHIFTAQSVHLLACVPDPLPVEVFDWSDPLMVTPPRPGPDGRIPVAGPGFGVELNRATVERLGTRAR